MNPLDALRPPLAPPAPPFWPPAPGWWLLFGVLLLATLYAWHCWRVRPPAASQLAAGDALEPMRQIALLELQRLPRPFDGQQAGPWLQQLNALLRRLCLARYPQDNCQTLSGRAWLAYLDNRCTAAGLTRWMILVEGVYRPDCRLDDKAISGLAQSVETWIRKHA